jgi:hypothetical protein
MLEWGRHGLGTKAKPSAAPGGFAVCATGAVTTVTAMELRFERDRRYEP